MFIRSALLILSGALAACVTIDPGVCSIAPEADGWVWIEGPPEGVPEVSPRTPAKTIIWFRNDDSGQIKACERYRDGAGCHEFGTNFKKSGNTWVELDEIDAIVCT